MSISDDSVEAALRYLAETEEGYAKAKATRIYLEETKRTVLATAFADAPEGSVASREAHAYTRPAYAEHCEKLRAAVYEEELMKAKRLRYELSIEVFRTMEASRRRGNIV